MKGTIRKKVGERTGVAWHWRFDHVDPVTGNRVTKRGSAPTRRECEHDLREAIQRVESGKASVDDKITVREYLVDRWLPSIASTVRPGTVRRYADIVKNHIVPALGGIRLAKLSALDLQQLYADRLAKGFSPNYVRYDHAVLHRALGQAVRMRVIDRNVADLVDPPRLVKSEATTWDAREVVKVLDLGDETDLAALWRLALLGGLRRGELLGLMWEDVDLERGLLAIRRGLIAGSAGKWELGAPKTASGRRTIALDTTCVSALRRHRAAQNAERLRLGAIWQDRGFIFTNETGGLLLPNALFLRFRRLIATAGVRVIRFHDMRHTCATLALIQGVHPKVVQERLGHATVAMTLDRYSHVTEGLQRDAAESIAAAVEAARKQVS